MNTTDTTESESFTLGPGIQECVFPLVTIVDDEVAAVGTGFVIGRDGLIVTASHVLEEASSKAIRRRTQDRGYHDHFEFYALYINDDEASVGGGVLPIDRMWAPERLDIGFGFLRLPVHRESGERLPLRNIRLRPALVSVGDNIAAVGYRKMKGALRRTESGPVVVEWEQELRVASGAVTAVYPEFRDRGLLPWPSFHTDAVFEPGMSGSPIFTVSGSVCGIVCSGSSPDEGGSHGSLIWPMFGCEIEVSYSGSDGRSSTLLYDLARRGLVDVDETLSQIEVQRVSDTERTVTIRDGRRSQK